MFLATERTDGISTSDVILRIIKDYDDYAFRQLDRGYSAKDLNIWELKAKKIKVARKLDNWTEEIKSRFNRVVRKWKKNSKRIINHFID